MAAPKEPVTDAELELLKRLWDGEWMTARELAAAAYGEPTASAIGTVQKLIQRLEAKGCVRRDRSAHTHRFAARVSQAAVVGKQIDTLAAKVSNGSFVPFITHLVQSRRLTPDEREAIRRLLDED